MSAKKPINPSAGSYAISKNALPPPPPPRPAMKPITPTEVTDAKLKSLPDEVIAAFNELIAENWNGHSASVLQKDVATRIVKKFEQKQQLVTRQQLFDRNWLDVEPIYRKAGWKVEYDKPGYCETYEASFKFSKK